MSNTKNNDKGKLILQISIPVILLLIIIRIVLYYVKSEGFSGLPVTLPLLLAGVLVFALFTSACFSAWVYQDCKRRGDDAFLWAVIVFIATPFIGLLLYFLRRSEIKSPCPACGHPNSIKASFCEKCGTSIQQKEDIEIMKKQSTHHVKYIVTGLICMALMLACMTGFIVSAATGSNVNTLVSSDDKVWNMGNISMNLEKYSDGVWELDFKSASKGFVAQQDMEINNADTDLLYADISCTIVPEGSSLVLWLVQGDIQKSIDVTSCSEPLEYSLNEFENGRIHVRLQINGVENSKSEIYIK